MNGFDVVARCLQAGGVEWMACFPANPLIDMRETIIVVIAEIKAGICRTFF